MFSSSLSPLCPSELSISSAFSTVVVLVEVQHGCGIRKMLSKISFLAGGTRHQIDGQGSSWDGRIQNIKLSQSVVRSQTFRSSARRRERKNELFVNGGFQNEFIVFFITLMTILYVHILHTTLIKLIHGDEIFSECSPHFTKNFSVSLSVYNVKRGAITRIIWAQNCNETYFTTSTLLVCSSQTVSNNVCLYNISSQTLSHFLLMSFSVRAESLHWPREHA